MIHLLNSVARGIFRPTVADAVAPLLRTLSLLLVAAAIAMLAACTKKQPSDAEDGATEREWKVLFDGSSLDEWDGDSLYWSIQNGNMVGRVTPTTLLNRNTFIIYKGEIPDDFELELDFKIEEAGNSGVNYRSERLTDHPYALRGYQADIDGKNNYTGQNYEERKRTTLAYPGEVTIISSQPDPGSGNTIGDNVKNNAWMHRDVVSAPKNIDSLKARIRTGDWNHCRIVARGNHLQHYINDMLMSDVTDSDTVNRAMSGKLGVQVHVGPPMSVEYRNIRVRPLGQ